MGDLLRLVALDGPVLGVGVLVALVWVIVRLESNRSENAAAHAAIGRNIDGVKQDVGALDQRLSKDIDAVKQDVRALDQRLTEDLRALDQRWTKHLARVEQQIRDDVGRVEQQIRDVKDDVRVLTSHLLSQNRGDPGTVD